MQYHKATETDSVSFMHCNWKKLRISWKNGDTNGAQLVAKGLEEPKDYPTVDESILNNATSEK